MSEHAPVPSLALEPLLLRLPEVAQVLAVSTSYVEQLVARGELPTVALPSANGTSPGRAVRVEMEALRAWVRAHAERAAAARAVSTAHTPSVVAAIRAHHAKPRAKVARMGELA